MSLRLSGSHKSSVERSLLMVRARIQTALDALDDEDGLVRNELEEADKALRSLEVRLSTTRTRPGPTSRLLEDEAATSAETRAWLLKNFTEHDIDLANTNVEIQSTSPSPSRRRSSAEAAENMQKVMSEREISDVLTKLGCMNFDALALADSAQAMNRCISVVASRVVRLPCFPGVSSDGMFKVMEQNKWIASEMRFTQAWLAFCMRLDTLYNPDTPYHCAAHAADVIATTHWLMRSEYISRRATVLDHFTAIAAAAIHDVGHPGKNNLWHQKTLSPLAVRYNDKSILENMHVALAFETMQRDTECNWYALLPSGNHTASDPHHSTDLQSYVRKSLISMVLATDLAKHSKHVQELAALAEDQRECADRDLRPRSADNEQTAKQMALARKHFLLDTVVHAADISNPSKPRDIMLQWTHRVLSEFWAQGDEERRLGLEVSPLCDRESGMASVPKGQMGFINFVVLPFFIPLAELLTEANEAVDQLRKNLEFWRGQDELNATFVEIFGSPPSPTGLKSFMSLRDVQPKPSD